MTRAITRPVRVARVWLRHARHAAATGGLIPHWWESSHYVALLDEDHDRAARIRRQVGRRRHRPVGRTTAARAADELVSEELPRATDPAERRDLLSRAHELWLDDLWPW